MELFFFYVNDFQQAMDKQSPARRSVEHRARLLVLRGSCGRSCRVRFRLLDEFVEPTIDSR